MTSITVFDGASSIGGNKIYVEERGQGVWLDFGMNFKTSGRFFQDFLSERTSRGVHDLIYLGIIPQVNCYRADLIPIDVDPSTYRKVNPKAVLLSHAHMDHCGNISLLDASIPVVASPISIAILKAWRDTANASFNNEVAYYSSKTPVDECDGYVLESERSKTYHCRDFYATSSYPDSLREFLAHRPGESGRNAKKLEPGTLARHKRLELPFEVDAYSVDHSIYGANGYILKGDSLIAYTGDLRLHGKAANSTRAFIRAAKDASILITEGTRISRVNSVEVTEQMVHDRCREAVESIKGLVVADFGARNFERLETFKKIANKTGRRLVVTAKDAYMLHALAHAEGSPRMSDDMLIYGELKSRRKVKWETEVVLEKCGERYVSPGEIRVNPDDFILCFSLFDLKHLLDVKTRGGGYVYSSSEAYTEEQEIDFLRLYEWIKFFGLKPYGFDIIKEGGHFRPVFTHEYHASGHLSTTDLARLVEEIDPDVLIPVHTEHPEWFSRYDSARILKNGETLHS